MTNFVQMYKSTDANAPTLTGQAGSLITVLNKCLVDGYTAASVANITRAGTVATVQLSSPNSTLTTGNYVTIAGCDQADYNGTFQITVNSSSQFTYTVANDPVTPATGTITYAKAGLGWTRPFTGTSKAVYRSSDVSTNQFYLRVDDSGSTSGGTKEAAVRGYETMTDVDVGSQAFPTTSQEASGLCWTKSSSADATARAWTVVGDGRCFYVQMNANGSHVSSNMFFFGWFPSYKSGDSFNTLIVGTSQFNTTGPSSGGFASSMNDGSSLGSSTTGVYVARNYTQLGGSFVMGVNNWMAAKLGGGNLAFPNPVDGGLVIVVPTLGENVSSAYSLRGRFPGLYAHLHGQSSANFQHYDQYTNITDLPGKTLTFMAFNSGSSPLGTFLDAVGPWT